MKQNPNLPIQIKDYISQPDFEQILIKILFITSSDGLLANPKNSLNPAQNQGHIPSAFNQLSTLPQKKFFIKFFNEEELNLINQLKYFIPMKQSIISLEQLLLSIGTEEFFKLDNEDQIIVFHLLFSYYCNTGTFPKGHYKLCVMRFINFPIIHFEKIFDYLKDWVYAILKETNFIKNMDLSLFFHNIKFIYNCNGWEPFSFDTFLRSRNIESMNAFLYKVDYYLFNNEILWEQTEEAFILCESLKYFKFALEKTLNENIIANNTFTFIAPSAYQNRKRKHKEIEKENLKSPKI